MPTRSTHRKPCHLLPLPSHPPQTCHTPRIMMTTTANGQYAEPFQTARDLHGISSEGMSNIHTYIICTFAYCLIVHRICSLDFGQRSIALHISSAFSLSRPQDFDSIFCFFSCLEARRLWQSCEKSRPQLFSVFLSYSASRAMTPLQSSNRIIGF